MRARIQAQVAPAHDLSDGVGAVHRPAAEFQGAAEVAAARVGHAQDPGGEATRLASSYSSATDRARSPRSTASVKRPIQEYPE